jgi:hypothetical protein
MRRMWRMASSVFHYMGGVRSMRKALFVFSAAAALALLAVPAIADSSVQSLPVPTFQADFNGVSANYVTAQSADAGSGAVVGDPRLPLGAAPAPGFAPTTIQTGDVNRTVFNTAAIYGPSGSFTPNVGALTGILYDLQLTEIDVSVSARTPTLTTYTLYYSPANVNPLTGTATAPAGDGGVLEMYNDPAQASGNTGTLFGAGPTAVVANPGSNPSGTPNNGTGPDEYPGVNESASDSLWLQGYLTSLGTDPNNVDPGDAFIGTNDSYVLYETITIDTANPRDDTGSFYGYAVVTGGSAASQIVPGSVLSIEGDTSLPGAGIYGSTDGAAAGNWAVAAHDPVSGETNTSIVPEPATMTLLGLGIAGLFARIRRKK